MVGKTKIGGERLIEMKKQMIIQNFQSEIDYISNLIKEGTETCGESSVVKLMLYKCRLIERFIKIKYFFYEI